MKIIYEFRINQSWDPTFGRKLSKCADVLGSDDNRTTIPEGFSIEMRCDGFVGPNRVKGGALFSDPTDQKLESVLEQKGITLAMATGCGGGASWPVGYYIPSLPQERKSDWLFFNQLHREKNIAKRTLDELRELERYCNEELQTVDAFANAFLEGGAEGATLARFVETISACVSQKKVQLR